MAQAVKTLVGWLPKHDDVRGVLNKVVNLAGPILYESEEDCERFEADKAKCVRIIVTVDEKPRKAASAPEC